MRHRYALYRSERDGLYRVGTFRCTGNSVRQISAYLYTRYNLPCDGAGFFLAPRQYSAGRWGDGALVPVEPRANT